MHSAETESDSCFCLMWTDVHPAAVAAPAGWLQLSHALSLHPLVSCRVIVCAVRVPRDLLSDLQSLAVSRAYPAHLFTFCAVMSVCVFIHRGFF